jgi:hypothetical protein
MEAPTGVALIDAKPHDMDVGWGQRVRAWWVRKELAFWQKRSPNCNSIGLPPYPLPQLDDGWVRREG